jgi:hypothetical protein
VTSKFTELAIDCADPNGLARFWCSVLDTPTSAKAMRAGSYLPTQRGTSSASLRTAAPDRRPHTAPDLLPVAYPLTRTR